MKQIKRGAKQPLACKKCKGKYGYQIIGFTKQHFINLYDEQGHSHKHYYGDETIIHRLGIVLCAK